MPECSYPRPVTLACRHRTVYDALAEEYELRAESLREVTEQALEPLTALLTAGSRVLDLGCGAGLVSQTLAGQGFETVALELSPKLAAFAQARSPRTDVQLGDYGRWRDPRPFAAIVAFAFIHLFPKTQAEELLAKMRGELLPGGLLLIGTTAAARASEGFELKADYPDAPARYRAHWTGVEFEAALACTGFEPLSQVRHTDPYGKRWLDFLVRRPI